MNNYQYVMRKLVRQFPVLPRRGAILEWVHGLKLGANSKRDYHKITRTLFRWLKRELGYPEVDLSLPRLPRNTAPPASWTQEEIHQILHVCQTPLERAVVILETQTAARRGGICSLREDRMTHSQDGSGGIAEVDEKMGRRILYLPDEAWRAVTFAMLGKGFLSPSHIPMKAYTLKTLMNGLLKRAGVWRKGVGNHAFRHSFSSEFIYNGGPQRLLPVLMGHSASDMTGHYTHIFDAEALEAARQYAPKRFLQHSFECGGQAGGNGQ